MSLNTTPGSPDADSYRTLAEINAYAIARGLTFPIAGDDLVPAEQAARRAATWLDGTFRSRFPGRKTGGRMQALEWPRTGATDQNREPIADDEIPREIGDAQCEAACRERAEPGSLSPDYVPSQMVKSESIGPISTTYRDTAGVVDARPIVTVIDDILSGLIGARSSTISSFVVRG